MPTSARLHFQRPSRTLGLRVFAAVIAAVLLMLVLPAAAQLPPLRLVAADSSSSDQTEDIPCRKVYLLLAKEALRRAGIAHECEALPWRRAQMMVAEGEQDAMVTVATAERAEYSVAAAETLYYLPLRAFTSSEHPQREALAGLSRIEQLRDWQLLSYFGDGWAQSRLETAGIPVAWSRDLATVLHQLAAQRGDLMISAEVEAMPLIRALGLSDRIVMLPAVFDSLEFKLQISKRSPYLGRLPEIESAIRGMREDGTIERISREAEQPQRVQ